MRKIRGPEGRIIRTSYNRLVATMFLPHKRKGRLIVRNKYRIPQHLIVIFRSFDAIKNDARRAKPKRKLT